MSNSNYQIDPRLMGELENHLRQLSNKYSKLLPIRLDLSYQTHSRRWHQRNNDYSTCDICKLMEYLMGSATIVGYAWVVEYTLKHGIHFHTVLYLNGQLQRKYYPVYQKAQAYWNLLTLNQGNVHDCNRNKASYEINGLNPFTYFDVKQQNYFRYALSYLAKREQKEIFGDMRGVLGVSYVPEPSGRGRPRIQ